MNQVLNRRLAITAGIGGAAALALAGCDQNSVNDLSQKFADIITQIQKGVKDACSVAGVIVPTASSVLAVLMALYGPASSAVVTAAMIKGVVEAITGQVCTPAPAPTAGRTPRAVKVHGVDVNFY